MAVQKIISPIDGSVVAERELASDAAVDAVLHAAQTAQSVWRATPIS